MSQSTVVHRGHDPGVLLNRGRLLVDDLEVGLADDDLPRSRTGRVPQWVRDEAVGRPASFPAWRSDAAVIRVTAQPRRVRRPARRISTAGTLLLVVLVAAVALGGPWLADDRTSGQLRAALAQWVSPDATPGAPYAPGDVSTGSTDDVGGEAMTAPDTAVPLPPAGERDFPTPGFEEGPAPLGGPPAASGEGGPHSFSAEQTGTDGVRQPVTWSPCRPIHVVTDVTGAPDGFTTQLLAVLGEVSAATGLRFVDDGLTAESADIDRAPYLPDLYGDRWAPVLVRFASKTEVALLSGDIAGVASPTHVTDPSSGRAHYMSGAVYLDQDVLDVQPQPGAEPVYVEVLRHELGHLVGLGHVDDPSQAMHPSTGGVRAFQAGDLAGLAALGRGPCAPSL